MNLKLMKFAGIQIIQLTSIVGTKFCFISSIPFRSPFPSRVFSVRRNPAVHTGANANWSKRSFFAAMRPAEAAFAYGTRNGKI